MPDQGKSTEQPQHKRSEVFRESFLGYFERPKDEAAMRRVGELVHDLACEGRALLEGKEKADIWRTSIRSAVGDFQQGVDQLAEMARDLDEAGSGGRETVRIVLAITDALALVEPIADSLDAALAAYLAAEPEE